MTDRLITETDNPFGMETSGEILAESSVTVREADVVRSSVRVVSVSSVTRIISVASEARIRSVA